MWSSVSEAEGLLCLGPGGGAESGLPANPPNARPPPGHVGTRRGRCRIHRSAQGERACARPGLRGASALLFAEMRGRLHEGREPFRSAVLALP